MTETVDTMITNHLKIRNQHLNSYEEEAHKILQQCASCNENPLYTNFRYDEICYAYNKFKLLGLDLENLFKFQRHISKVIYPWNSEYNTLRFGVNKLCNVYPLIIVMAETERDVIRSFIFARKYNIEISLRGGAHSFQGFSLCEGMVIDQSKRIGIEYNEKTNIVKCEAGVLLGPLTDYLSQYNRSIVLGGCVNNGLAGFTLGGGIGTLIRQYGTNSDNVVEAKMILATGEVVIVNKNNYQDLFWAIKGAGIGNYGIILSLSILTYHIDKVWSYDIEYSFDKTKTLVKMWQTWTKDKNTPVTLMSNLVIYNNRCRLYGIYTESSKYKLLKYLQKFLDIKYDSFECKRESYVDIAKTGTTRWYPFIKFKNAFMDKPLTDKAIDIIIRYMNDGSDHSYIYLAGLGGMNNKIDKNKTAFVHRNMLSWVHINAQWHDQEEAINNINWANNFYDALEPFLSDEVYQNTPDNDLKDYLIRYYGSNLPKLVSIKQKYDPHNIFHHEQSIPVSLSY
jgi:hypothetical protein